MRELSIEEYRELRKGLRQKQKCFPIEKIKLFEPWEITEENLFKYGLKKDPRILSLLAQKQENWYPIILDKNLLVDGYHRYALAKYKLNSKCINSVQTSEISKEERLCILDDCNPDFEEKRSNRL